MATSRSLPVRILIALARTFAMFVVGFTITFAVVAWPRWILARDEAVEMAQAHLRHDVAHPGWSFPGRVWSDAVPLEGTSKERLVLEARARGYVEACPPKRPGEVCTKTGTVSLRGGLFAEGPQPPGEQGWSRPLALEPVQIGTLMGPDAELRWHLPLNEAPRHLIAALLAAEDRAFYDHHGVNFSGMARAAYANARGVGVQQGASTLTMQVVRNLSQDKEKTLQRKLREMMAALAIDTELGKDTILQIYLDAPYLGQDGSMSICGFEAASWYYYGVSARDMSLGQAATLASILPAPGRFSPEKHPEVAKERRDRTLRTMAELGWPAAEVQAALAEPVVARRHQLPADRYAAYLQATRQWLEANLDPGLVYGSGLDVFTALDLVAQESSDTVIPQGLKFLEGAVGRRKQPLEGAGAVVSSVSGYLVAAYGGSQRLPTDFNRATQARRQAGSSLKPLTYAHAFSLRAPDGSRRFNAASTVRNDKHVFPNTDGWSPRNISGDYSSTSSLAMGLAWSQNVATASVLEASGGPVPLKAFAKSLGYETGHWRDELGLALGSAEVTPLEQARFVATVIGGGKLASGRPVVTAIDVGGTVRVAPEGERAQVMRPEDAALTRGLMRLVIEYGTGGASRGGLGKGGYGGPAIGKTGTTDSEKDLWFIGGTPTYAAALWLGYDQPERIGASASDFAAPVWGWWANAVHRGVAQKDFGGVKTRGVAVCTQTGKHGNGTCRMIGAPFLDGEKPGPGGCPISHPPPDPEAPDRENFWERRERMRLEREAAAAGTAPPAPDAPPDRPAEP
ncbi:MAG: transglycosylase domain-containing protein [Deltaproteobacteria bacterium]|nr:transglycosylase domain-containing protein [Deltaproteobacteria bacterium]